MQICKKITLKEKSNLNLLTLNFNLQFNVSTESFILV